MESRKRKSFKKLVTLVSATTLMSLTAPIFIETGSHVVHARTTAQTVTELVNNDLGSVSYSYSYSEVGVEWSLAVKKHATSDPAKMRFKLDEAIQSVEVVRGEFVEEVEVADGWFAIGDAINDADEYVLRFTTNALTRIQQTTGISAEVMFPGNSVEPVTEWIVDETMTATVPVLEEPEAEVDDGIVGDTEGLEEEDPVEEPADESIDTEEAVIDEAEADSKLTEEPVVEDDIASDGTDNHSAPNSAGELGDAKVNLMRGARASGHNFRDLSGNGLDKISRAAKKLGNMFALPNQKGTSSTGSGIVAVNNPESDDNEGIPYDKVVLGGQENWLSIWSADQYKLDFSEDFRGRAYLKFAQGADGLAFVMHNDSRGTGAITEADSAQDGQNIGVYGGHNGTKADSTVGNPAADAVQKSVAIEFDLYLNQNNQQSGWIVGDRGSAFDMRVPGLGSDKNDTEKHLAYTFPGNEDSYQAMRADNFPWYAVDIDEWTAARNARLRHFATTFTGDESLKKRTSSIQSLDMLGSGWYEFRFDYKQNVGLTYYLYNPTNQTATPAVQISQADLARELNLTGNNQTAYWGFTAGNGSEEGTSEIVFTETPVETHLALESSIFDSEGMDVQVGIDDLFEDSPFIEGGEAVTLKSEFDYTSENSFELTQWNGNVDSALYDFTPGALNVIVKHGTTDVSGQMSATITADGKITVTPKSNQEITLKNGESLSFTFDLKTKVVDQQTKTMFQTFVEGKEVVSESSVEEHTDPAYFWIYTSDNPTNHYWKDNEGNSSNERTVSNHDVADGYQDTFYWTDKDEGDMVGFKVVKVDENGDPVSGFEPNWIEPVVTPAENAESSTDLEIPAADISYGDNFFRIYPTLVVDGETVVNEKSFITLNFESAQGYLKFVTAPSTLEWSEKLSLDMKGKIHNRSAGNDMIFTVRDSYAEAIEDWTITGVVQTTKSNPDYDLAWKDNAGEDPEVIGVEDSVTIQDTNFGDRTADFTRSKTYAVSEGFLLQTNEMMSAINETVDSAVIWTLNAVESTTD